LLKKLYYKHIGIPINKNVLEIHVPSVCETREDKELIIFETIELLEQNIKINKNGRKKT
tara:strand:+ start:1135 stop:1311 length:177 start_codon:yes stop_codon:yes gene_type:complete